MTLEEYMKEMKMTKAPHGEGYIYNVSDREGHALPQHTAQAFLAHEERAVLEEKIKTYEHIMFIIRELNHTGEVYTECKRRVLELEQRLKEISK